MHSRSRSWWTRWWAIAAAVIVVGGGAVTAVAALTGGASGASAGAPPPVTTPPDPGAAARVAAAEARLAASVTLTPGFGSAAVPLGTPITLASSAGNLSLVQVTDPGGTPIAGTLMPGGQSWRLTGALIPATTYKVTATVTQPSGLSAAKTGTFTTAPPAVVVSASSIFPTPGLQVGVGQPIVVRFDHSITDPSAQAAIVSHFTVEESKPAPGGWYWFSPTELHFRPETYWPANEQITVKGNLTGWNAGDGRWGGGTLVDSFTTGDARVSVANLATHEMTVTLNGALIATYPISGGRPQYPTMDGTHIVLDRETVVHMVSSTVGIPVNSPNGYDEYVYSDVHISDSGEYVHAAPWSVGDQGFVNVSHGCINLSSGNAATFYNFSRVGDVVQVVGGPRPPAPGDHGVMDWTEPWSQWMPGHVTGLTTAA